MAKSKIKATLSKGDTATVYHAGTDSFYEAVIRKPLSKRSVAAENKAAAGEDPRPLMTIFRQALSEAKVPSITGDRLIYNDLSKDKTKRRLKVAGTGKLTTAQLNRVHEAMVRHFGDERILEVGITPKVKNVPSWYRGTFGEELYVRMTAH